MSAPPVSVRCNVRPCALDTDIAPLPLPYAAWSSCSVACGGGVRTRTAACAPASACATLLPPQYQPCGTRPCARYEWRAQGWCSAERDADRIVALTCGGGGVWEREVMCVDAARAHAGGSDAPALAEYQCDGPKPSSVRLQTRSRYAPDRASSHPRTVGAAGATLRAAQRVAADRISACDAATRHRKANLAAQRVVHRPPRSHGVHALACAAATQWTNRLR